MRLITAPSRPGAERFPTLTFRLGRRPFSRVGSLPKRGWTLPNSHADFDPFICPHCHTPAEHLGFGWYWCRGPGCRTVYRTRPLPEGVIAAPTTRGPDDRPYTFFQVATPHHVVDLTLPATPRPGPDMCPTPGPSTGANAVPIKLTDRQELILAAMDALGRSAPGPWRGRKVAGQATLDYDSRLRTELSNLCKLGYLRNDGAGYARTDKPYQCP